MPCDYRHYPPNWPRIRALIVKREQGCCAWCRAANGQLHPRTGSVVVLTIAHLGPPYAQGGDKHEKHDIRAENLAALCQACHLGWDHADHQRHANATRQQRARQRQPDLFTTALTLSLPVHPRKCPQ